MRDHSISGAFSYYIFVLPLSYANYFSQVTRHAYDVFECTACYEVSLDANDYQLDLAKLLLTFVYEAWLPKDGHAVYEKLRSSAIHRLIPPA